MNQLTDGWLPSANGLLRASTYLWLSAPFLQPLYLRSGVAGSQVLHLGFLGAFGVFGGRSVSVFCVVRFRALPACESIDVHGASPVTGPWM